jgi:hypothetical protein
MVTTTVTCVFVKGHVPFTVDYVTRLAAMVNRLMDRPYSFVCFTDRPEQIPSHIRTIQIPNLRPLWGWWSKLECFNAAHGLTGRILYLDLDSLVVAPLAPILDYPSPFALIPNAGTFQGSVRRNGRRRLVPLYNSSCMVWDAGVNRKLFDKWTPSIAADLHGDQDHIAEMMPHLGQFPLAWFPRISELGNEPPGPEAKVVLVKKPKNEEAAKRWPWVDAAWKAA